MCPRPPGLELHPNEPMAACAQSVTSELSHLLALGTSGRWAGRQSDMRPSGLKCSLPCCLFLYFGDSEAHLFQMGSSKVGEPFLDRVPE